jgi:hypothetical protein
LLIGGSTGEQSVGVAEPFQVVHVETRVERQRHYVVADAGDIAVQ